MIFCNTLGLPHWSSKAPCWECDTQNCIPCAFGTGREGICLEKQRIKTTSRAALLANPVHSHALFQLPGVSAKHVRGDPLHILFCKGLCAHLTVIFDQIQIEYSKQECKNRLTNFKIPMFSEVGKPWANWAFVDQSW